MYDLFFIDQGTPTSNERWQSLKLKFPHAQKRATVQEALAHTFTKFAWIIDDDCDIEYKFNYIVPDWDKQYIHRFLQDNKNYLGVYLIPRGTQITNREWQYQFFTGKIKDIQINATYSIPSDVVFISYNESFADNNYKTLLNVCPNAKRVHGIKGIHQAHIEAAKQVTTPMFWVVDADAELVDDFNFGYYVPKHDRDIVHVWRSRNPVNNLEYGNGGVKLLPTNLTLAVDVNSPDMTTSISKKFKSMPSVSNVTAFNVDPFTTWRSAFRECAKLSSRTIIGQVNDETQQRLDAWCTVGADNAFGEYAILGAIAGREYGTTHKDNITALKHINDYMWLEEQFNARHK
jgi:hypothetical protein